MTPQMDADRDARLAALAIVEAHATDDLDRYAALIEGLDPAELRAVVGVLVAMVASTPHPGGGAAAVTRAWAGLLGSR
jgi:hypothetical protein